MTPYIGFNEDEVIDLCEKYEIDFAEVRRWYDVTVLEITMYIIPMR